MKKIFDFFPVVSGLQVGSKELISNATDCIAGSGGSIKNYLNKNHCFEFNEMESSKMEVDDQQSENKEECVKDMISVKEEPKPHDNILIDVVRPEVLCDVHKHFSDTSSYSCLLTPVLDCLESLQSLKEKCSHLGLKFIDYEEPVKIYEVDLIISHKDIESERHYEIKWKNYPTSTNTWEPQWHLTGCDKLISYYHAILNPKTKLTPKLLEHFIGDLIARKPTDILTLKKVCALSLGISYNELDELKLTQKLMKQRVKDILHFSPSKISKLMDKLFKMMQFAQARKIVLIKLQEWENEINEHNHAYISVENNVDLETPPVGFKFIHDYINETVTIPEEPVAFCHCIDCYKNKDKCCPNDSEGHFAYSIHRRLLLQPGYPIYECNKYCQCSSSCVNRVVQHGQKVKVCIFRTSNDCGWGLKTLENIEKDQFVLEYLGEIITSEAAEARGRIYDYIGRSYLFDLDYGVDNCSYTVDAGHVGNAAHFINHSCDPNLHVFAVWINQPDPNLPRLAFFAKRKIMRGEELTFDYKMVQKDRFSTQDPDPDEERILCRCNSKRNCRKFLF